MRTKYQWPISSAPFTRTRVRADVRRRQNASADAHTYASAGKARAGLVGTAMTAEGGAGRRWRRAAGEREGTSLPSDDTCGSTPTISTAATLHALLRRVVFTCSRFRARARARTRSHTRTSARARAPGDTRTRTRVHAARTHTADRARTRAATGAGYTCCVVYLFAPRVRLSRRTSSSHVAALEKTRSEDGGGIIRGKKRGICLHVRVVRKGGDRFPRVRNFGRR